MKFLLSTLLLLVLCGVTLGEEPPCWPPPSYVMVRQWQNVLDYGAVGDDSTLNDAAFLAAITAAGDKGIVFVPSGTFVLSDTLVLGDSMTLCGVGVASVIKADSGHNENIITITGKTGVVIRDLMIDGNKANNDSLPYKSAIIFEGSTDLTVSRVNVVNMHGQSIGVGTEGNPSDGGLIEYCTISGGTSNHIDINSSRNVRILYNKITGAHGGEAGIFLGHSKTHGHLVLGNEVDSANWGVTLDNSVFSDSTPDVRDIRIIGNYFSVNQASGIGLYGAQHCVVAANECIANNRGAVSNGSGIYLTDGNSRGSSYNLIVGNVCYDSTATKLQAYGLYTSGLADSNTVLGNNFGGNLIGTDSLAGSYNIFAPYADTSGILYGNLWVSPTWAPEIQTYIAGQNVPLQVKADSVQFKFVEQNGWFYLWVGDSAYATGIPFQIGGPNGDNLPAIVLRADTTYIDGNVEIDSFLTVGAYKLPMVDGTVDQVLTTNGSGVASWNTQAGAGGGESNTIQDTGVYNETEGFGLAGGKAGVDLHVKGLIEGANITIAKSGDSALTITAAGGSGFWAFRDSTTIVYVNDSTGDTVLFVQDTTGLQGIRVEGLTVTGGITVPNNSISNEELDEGASFSWTNSHNFGNSVFFDDGVGDSPNLVIKDADNKSLLIKKYDAGFSSLYNDEGAIYFLVRGDQDDYIFFDTSAANVPMISTAGACDLVINASSGEISFGDENLTTTGNIVVSGAYHITSAEGDSAYMSKKYIDDAAGGLTAQSVKGDHVDSTAEDFVFVNPYKGTSAVGDSVLTTRKELGDTSTAIRADFPAALTNQGVKGDHVDSTAEDFVFVNPYKGTSAVGDSVLTTRKEMGDTSTAIRGDFPSVLWVASNDTMFMVDGDGDTLAAFWDDDAGNVRWQVATEDQTLRILLDTIGIGGDIISEFARYGLVVTANGLEVDTADAVADAEAKTVTGNAVFDFCETTKNYLLSSELYPWTDSTGFLVGWGGVAKSVVNDTNYFRFEGGSEFDTTGGSVSIAANAIDTSKMAHAPLGKLIRDTITAEGYITTAGVIADSIGDSLGNYFDTATVVDTIQAIAAGYLPLAGGAMTGAITTNSTFDTVDVATLAAKVHKEDLKPFMFTLADPDALYATDAEWSIDPRTAQAITIDSFTVSLDADPTTELTFSLKFADAFIGFANAVVIDDTATVAGVTTVTGGFGDATVPAGKCIYWLFDADPDDAITQASVKIYYSID